MCTQKRKKKRKKKVRFKIIFKRTKTFLEINLIVVLCRYMFAFLLLIQIVNLLTNVSVAQYGLSDLYLFIFQVFA